MKTLGLILFGGLVIGHSKSDIRFELVRVSGSVESIEMFVPSSVSLSYPLEPIGQYVDRLIAAPTTYLRTADESKISSVVYRFVVAPSWLEQECETSALDLSAVLKINYRGGKSVNYFVGENYGSSFSDLGRCFSFGGSIDHVMKFGFIPDG